MEPQLSQEWVELRTKTYHHLRSRGHVLQPKHWPLSQLLVMPSFDDTWCIDLLETDGVLSAYRTTWHSSEDVQAFENGLVRLRFPRPFVATISSTKLDHSETEIKQLLSTFEEIDFPTDWKDRPIGIDGTIYEFQFGDRPVLEWWSRFPKDWSKDLCDAIEKLSYWE